MKQRISAADLPTVEQICRERSRLRSRRRYEKNLGSTLGVLAVVAAAAVLAATLWFPVFRIYGTSMEPALSDGQIVLGIKTRNLKPGEIAAFYCGNQLLIKRCVAGPGDWVEIDGSGGVRVNGVLLEEPYLAEKALGQSDLTFPYQVPEGHYFVLGDNREESVDSRNSAVGPVARDAVAGRVIFRLWPMERLGTIR